MENKENHVSWDTGWALLAWIKIKLPLQLHRSVRRQPHHRAAYKTSLPIMATPKAPSHCLADSSKASSGFEGRDSFLQTPLAPRVLGMSSEKQLDTEKCTSVPSEDHGVCLPACHHPWTTAPQRQEPQLEQCCLLLIARTRTSNC